MLLSRTKQLGKFRPEFSSLKQQAFEPFSGSMA